MEPAHVELRDEVGDDRHRQMSAWAGDRHIAIVTVGTEGEWPVAITMNPAEVLGRPEVTALLGAIVELFGRLERSEIVLVSSNLLLRYQARQSGFTGGLRSGLKLDLAGATVAQPEDATFLADLQALLPTLTVQQARPQGLLRSFLKSASSGIEGTAHFTAQASDGLEPLRVAVPVRPDIMAECVALALDTAMSVRMRFQPLVGRVRISYDHVVHGLRTGSLAGVAMAGAADIHLNPAFALAGELETLLRSRGRQQSASPPGGILPPFTWIDGLVAHEFWHQIEAAFEATRYKDSVAFRHDLGLYFGVETIEHVTRGGTPGAPPAWQEAHQRLTEEVSAYAATAPKEASAELFKLWWCTRADPPPVARHFGAVLTRFLPEAGR